MLEEPTNQPLFQLFSLFFHRTRFRYSTRVTSAKTFGSLECQIVTPAEHTFSLCLVLTNPKPGLLQLAITTSESAGWTAVLLTASSIESQPFYRSPRVLAMSSTSVPAPEYHFGTLRPLPGLESGCCRYCSVYAGSHPLKSRDQSSIETHALDAIGLDARFGGQLFSHILSIFMLQYSTQPTGVLGAIYHNLQPGGVVGIGLWGEMKGPVLLWEEAYKEIDPHYKIPPPHEYMAWTEASELEVALKRAGFRGIESEIWPLNFGCQSTEELMEFWYEGGNPVPTRLTEAWIAKNGDSTAVRRVHDKIARERYNDARGVVIEVLLTTARKWEAELRLQLIWDM